MALVVIGTIRYMRDICTVRRIVVVVMVMSVQYTGIYVLRNYHIRNLGLFRSDRRKLIDISEIMGELAHSELFAISEVYCF